MNDTFRKRLLDGEKLFGTIVTFNEPAVTEILTAVGYDWLFLDSEHATYSTGDLTGMMQAAGNNVACIVRVPATEEGIIKRTLDAGADGIIIFWPIFREMMEHPLTQNWNRTFLNEWVAMHEANLLEGVPVDL